MIMPSRVTDQWDKEPDGTEEDQPVSRNEAITHCEMLLNDIRINWDYCKQKRDFAPDQDDIDLIEALHAEMEYYLKRYFKAAEE